MDRREDPRWDEAECGFGRLFVHVQDALGHLALSDFEGAEDARGVLIALRDVLADGTFSICDDEFDELWEALDAVLRALAEVDVWLPRHTEAPPTFAKAVRDLGIKASMLALYCEYEAVEADRVGDFIRAAALRGAARQLRFFSRALWRLTDISTASQEVQRGAFVAEPPGHRAAVLPISAHAPPNSRQDVPLSTLAAVALAA